MDLKIGDKLICIVNYSRTFAPNEVVEIERMASSGGDTYYKIKGYTLWLNNEQINNLFRNY